MTDRKLIITFTLSPAQVAYLDQVASEKREARSVVLREIINLHQAAHTTAGATEHPAK